MESGISKFLERFFLIIGSLGTIFACYVGLLALGRPETRQALLPFVSSDTPQVREIPVTVEVPVTVEIPITVAVIEEKVITTTPLPTYTLQPTYTLPPAPTAIPLPTFTPTQSVLLPFLDNFDTGPRPEWQSVRGTWRMIDGQYSDGDEGTALVGDPSWENYLVEFDVFFRDHNYPITIIVRSHRGSYMAIETNCCHTELILVDGGRSTSVARNEIRGLQGWCCEWYETHLAVEVNGNTYTVFSNGERILQAQDNTLTHGLVGISYRYQFDPRPRFDNFSVTPL